MLVKMGAFVNYKCNRPITSAANIGRGDIVTFLIQVGADPWSNYAQLTDIGRQFLMFYENPRTVTSARAIHEAVRNGDVRLMSSLLQKSVSCTDLNNVFRTDFGLMSHEMRTLLLKRGADPGEAWKDVLSS
jgi:ankyrin repeat protein